MKLRPPAAATRPPLLLPRQARAVRRRRALGLAAAGSLAIALGGCYVRIDGDGLAIGGLEITQQPADAAATVGAQAFFAVGAAATGTLSFQWQRDGIELGGARQSSYRTPPVTLADDGARFSVRVCNELACVESRAARLTVVP